MRLFHTNEGMHEGWAPVPSHGLWRIDEEFVLENLRCPVSTLPTLPAFRCLLSWYPLLSWASSFVTGAGELPVQTAISHDGWLGCSVSAE